MKCVPKEMIWDLNSVAKLPLQENFSKENYQLQLNRSFTEELFFCLHTINTYNFFYDTIMKQQSYMKVQKTFITMFFFSDRIFTMLRVN